ncbi:MAG: hypothetical protein AAGD14_01250 [Planctomycetota bacterium]
MKRLGVLLVLAGLGWAQGDTKKKAPTWTPAPTWKEGQRTAVTLRITKDSQLKMSFVVSTIKDVTDCRYEQLVTAAENGRPIRARRTFSTYDFQRTTDVVLDGKKRPTRKERKKHPLAGRTIEVAAKKGALVPTTEIEGIEIIEDMLGGADWLWLLPPKPVRVGESWTVAGDWAYGKMSTAFVIDTVCTLKKLETDLVTFGFKTDKIVEGTATFSRKMGRFTHVVCKARNDQVPKDGGSITTTYVFTQTMVKPR